MHALIYTFVTVIITSLFVKTYFKKANKFCKSKKKLNGKTCVVTGGTTGMGFEIAKEFARRGARVIIACPFDKEGDDAERTIVKETGNKNVIFKNLDLASLESTRTFANEILKQEDRLDILVNNAGIGPSQLNTKDGMNLTMQVHYYGHVLLTTLLLPLLKKTGSSAEKSRIVNTSSIYSYVGSYEPGIMNKQNYWYLFQLYANSKICLMLMATELTKKLQGKNVIVNTIDPGAVGTGIFERNLGVVFGVLLRIILYVLVKTPWEGAQTALYAALDDEVGNVSGVFMGNCQIKKGKALAYDAIAAKTCWDESVRLVRLKDSELDI